MEFSLQGSAAPLIPEFFKGQLYLKVTLGSRGRSIENFWKFRSVSFYSIENNKHVNDI